MASTTKRLGIDQITAASELQARETLSEDAIADYAAIYSADNGNATLPPIRVVWDQSTETYWLVDGWHRLYGAKRAKVAKLSCEVVNGTKAFAILEACGANDEHGVRRTPHDKRKAVRMILEQSDWFEKSDVWVAEHCRVGRELVAKVRAEFQRVQPVGVDRLNKDGKRRPTPAKAAKQRAAVAEAIEANPAATVREIAEETGASVGTVQNVKTSAASIVLDGVDKPVPAELRDAHDLAGALMALARGVDRFRRESQEFSEKRGGEWLQMQEIDAAVRHLKGLIADSRYHCQCPDCEPGKRRKGCKRCKGAGFLPHYKRGTVNV